MLNHQYRLATLGALMCLIISTVHAQQSGKKAYTFRGKVEKMDTSPKPLTVTNEPIEGWMGTMTMAYGVDKPEALRLVKVGDRITAKVYEGDFTLYEVQVVSQQKTEAPRETTKAGMRLEDLEQLALASN